MPFQNRYRTARCYVPNARRVVGACRHDPLAIGAEGGVVYLSLMSFEAPDYLAGQRVPQKRSAVVGCNDIAAPRHLGAHNAHPIMAEHGAPHRRGMSC